MFRFAGLGVFFALVLGSSGCVQLSKELTWQNRIGTRAVSQDRTVTESYSEHLHRVNAVIDQDAAAIVEDWDLFWQRDRNSRLSRWHVR